MAKSSRSEAGLSRRSVLKAGAGAGAALGALVIGKPGPFIGNAEAATPTLRLLMWQPYAMKDVIAQFETDMKAKFAPTFFDGNSEAFNKLKVGGTKDFDMVQADGFWPRLYFKQGLTQAVDYGKIPNMGGRLPRISAGELQAARGRDRRAQGRGAELLGRLRHHRQHVADRRATTSARSICCSTRNMPGISPATRGSRRTSR